MNKKLFLCMFTFAATLCSSVLTSCGDDDDDPVVPTPEPVATKYDVEFLTTVTVDQAKYFDQSFELKYDNKTKTVNLSEMNDVTNNAAYDSIKTVIKSTLQVLSFDSELSEVKFYSYSLGSYTKGSFQLVSTPTSVKADHPTDGAEIQFVNSYYFGSKITGTNDKPYFEVGSNAVQNGLLTDEESLKEYAELNKDNTKGYSL